VYAFYRLTTYSAGLDRIQPPREGSLPRLKFLTRPMLALIVAAAVFGILGLISL
jgi:hypothetical protein